MIDLYDQGRADEAQALLVRDLQPRYRQVYDACARFLAANEGYIARRVAAPR